MSSSSGESLLEEVGEEVEGAAAADCLATAASGSAKSAAAGRRVYPTSFKVRVLDYYHISKNQRGTARKFSIHRRQIQKWLQIEEALRNNLHSDLEEEEALDCYVSEDNMIELSSSSDEALNLCIKNNNNGLIIVDQEESMKHDDIDIVYDLSTRVSVHQAPQSPGVINQTGAGKRRSFTLQFKLDVLDAFYTHSACRGNQRATARLFGINRRQVQKWLCQEAQLRSEATVKNDVEPSAKRQRLGKWIWSIPKWNCEEQRALSPPQDTALCLVKVEKEPAVLNIPSIPSSSTTVSTSPKPKRHSYPLDFKLQALDAYHDDTACRGNQRAVAKRFCIHRRQVQKWLKQETQLRQRSALGKETVVRNPAVLKPVQTPPWCEELRAPTQCW